MMRLGVDARGIDSGPGVGIAHATRELIDSLQERAMSVGIELRVYREAMSGSELARRLKHDGIDHVFVPSGAVSPFVRGHIFPWVHDLAIFEHPEWFPQSPLKRFLTTRMFLYGLRRAKHIFAVSEDTKWNIEKIVGIGVKNITVTRQSVKSIKSIMSVKSLEPKYALILGTVEPRKNVSFIVGLWAEVQRRVPNARFVVAGRAGWGNVDVSGAERVETFDDARRNELLSGASMLLLPSLHEGFGRTALEAMSIGVPVIASRRGAIPEVVGEAGVLLEPDDREGWVKSIVDGFQGRIDGGQGKEQAMKFSWENTAGIILAKIIKHW